MSSESTLIYDTSLFNYLKKLNRTKNRLVFVLVFLIGYNGCIHSQGASKQKIRCEYLLYLPKDYSTQDISFPLIIYLHGGSQRGTDLSKLKRYGLPYFIDKGQNYDFIIASPQCPEYTTWNSVNWFDSLFLDLCSRYRIDKSRVYVTGISMGGYGAWQVAMDYPDTFAAIVPLCGGCFDSTNICRIKELPVWTFHGSADSVVMVNETERLVARLNKCGGHIIYTRLENEGHFIQYLYEKKPEIYEWMLKQSVYGKREK